VAYADPVVFAAAVAMRTHRVRIGFAVVELALHHPVRLAVQTALVDNLSRGRLIVGTGRGSAYNAYEYFGFGTTLAEGHEMLPEAEALLIKAWTTDDVRHAGRGIHVKRDSWVSVMYAEELNPGKSSVTLQRTDRHGSMGQKSADFQWSL
jgi:alkanesulfonate monooxygenase SsuD/methylene tetrahydromethanopterin reductase-like flavin-dependent oxidoreductase (luciferase family)